MTWNWKKSQKASKKEKFSKSLDQKKVTNTDASSRLGCSKYSLDNIIIQLEIITKR
jgi:hypothetical protein